MAERKALHAYLSDEARGAWDTFSRDNGVSMTGLLEALGLDLAEEIAANGDEGDGLRKDWVKAGRRIDADRRARGGS